MTAQIMLRSLMDKARKWIPGERIAWVDGLNRTQQGTCLGYVGHRKQHLAVVDDKGELWETVVDAAQLVAAPPLQTAKVEQLREKWRYGHQSGMLLLPA